jgi:hypothetical protein
MNTSKRKPHNHLAGYVCERKHTNGGHLVLFDAPLAGLDDDWGRWVVVWMDGPDPVEQGDAIGPNFTNQREARAFIKHEASGPADFDWGGYYSDGSTSSF